MSTGQRPALRPGGVSLRSSMVQVVLGGAVIVAVGVTLGVA